MSWEASKTYTIVPATPGWFVCTRFKTDDPDPGYDAWHDEPIIAWEVERHDRPYRPSIKQLPDARCVSRMATPITADPTGFNEDRTAEWAIKRPDGRFYTSDGAILDAKCELSEYFNEPDADAA
jgi:hypothetical protein